MASARKRWFRMQNCSLRESVETRGVIAGLLAVWSNRWADDGLNSHQARGLRLSKGEVAAITGRSHFKVGAKLIQNCLKSSEALVEIHSNFISIWWPKVPEFQGWVARERASVDPSKAREMPESAPAPAQGTRREDSSRTSVAAVRSRSRPTDVAIRLSMDLRDRLHAKGVKAPTDVASWAREIDRCLTIDGRGVAECREVIEWLFTANLEREAQFVVHSAKALREKFDRIKAQMNAPSKRRAPEGDAIDAARRLMSRIGGDSPEDHGPDQHVRGVGEIRHRGKARALPSGDE